MSPSDTTTIARCEAASLLDRYYGISGAIQRLDGEKDQNFLVTTSAGLRYVLKISHREEKIGTVCAQREALTHIRRVDPGLDVPTILPAKDGAFELHAELGDGTSRITRVLSYLEGTMLHETAACARQDGALGAFLARVDLALRDLAVTQPGPEHPWDLQRLPSSRPMIAKLADSTVKSWVSQAYDDFERHVTPALPGLRAQPIHNDMNPYNVVMDTLDPCIVRGIIDFGDMNRGPVACDAAVGAAYRWSPNEYPLAGAARFLQGYSAVYSLEEREVDLILDMIRGRLAMIINVGNWQAISAPDNSAYALRLRHEATSSFDRLRQVARAEGRWVLHTAAGTLR